jgi:hypothetical protein
MNFKRTRNNLKTPRHLRPDASPVKDLFKIQKLDPCPEDVGIKETDGEHWLRTIFQEWDRTTKNSTSVDQEF